MRFTKRHVYSILVAERTIDFHHIKYNYFWDLFEENTEIEYLVSENANRRSLINYIWVVEQKNRKKHVFFTKLVKNIDFPQNLKSFKIEFKKINKIRDARNIFKKDRIEKFAKIRKFAQF